VYGNNFLRIKRFSRILPKQKKKVTIRKDPTKRRLRSEHMEAILEKARK